MSIQGAMAASLRRFDPYPEFDNVRVFRGRPETGGRQFYKTAGLIVPRFEMVSGVQIIGGAGFGRREINSAWRGARADEPLIGDGGLRNAEARPNSIRNPVAAGAVAGTPGAAPTTWSIGGAGVTISIVQSGVESGLPFVDVRFFGTPTSSQFITAFFDAAGCDAAVGQTQTVAAYFKLVGGSLVNVAALRLRLWEYIDSTYNGAVHDQVFVPTAALSRVGKTGTVGRPGTNKLRPGLAASWVSGDVDFTLRIAAPNLKLGPDINDPPILQTSGLPATRTGYSYRETGRNIAPVHYGVARARLVADAANHAANYPRLLSLRPASGQANILWVARKSDGGQRFGAYGDDGTGVEINPGTTPVVGEYQTLAWARRDGSLAISANGAAPLSAATSGAAGSYSRVGYMEDAVAPGNNPSNAETALFATRNGEISNDALQALSARFAA